MLRTAFNIFSSWKKIAWASLCFLSIFFAILLAKKSWEEQKFLTEFTEHVMIRESGVYTLLGSKPMTFINMSYKRPTKKQRLNTWNDFSDEVKKDYKPKDIYFPSYNAQRLLAKWRSLGKKMTGDTYCFTEPQENELLFINLPLCIKTISEYEALFSTILETELSPEEIARNLGVKNSPVWKRILKSHLLTGLLCGFGLENAKGFHICTQPKGRCSTASTQPTSVFIKNHPKLSEINIPSFSVYPGGENVVTRYQSEREAIIATCSDHSFKRLALKKLKQKHR